MKKVLSLFAFLFLTSYSFAQTTERWNDGVGSVTSGSKTAVATDLIGNVYTAGTVSGTGGTDWEIISYKPDGTSRWTMTLNGSGSGADAATGIAVDSAFNIYVCGYTVNSSSNEDITVRKIDSAGSTTWTQNYTQSSTSNDRANAIVVKGSYVYVTGKSQSTRGDYDCAILKLAVSDGSVSWASFFNGSGSGLDVGNAITVNSSADVYVVGSTVGTSTDQLLLKYSSTGTKTWSKTAGGSGTDELFSVALDGSGNIYATGYKTVSGGTTTDYTTAKLNSAGTSQWAATYNGSFSGYDKAVSIALDGSGYVYVTGSSESASGNTDYLTICYNSSGTASWTQRYNGPGNAADEPSSLLIDGTDVAITGASKNSSANYDFTTLSYTCSGGTLNWTMRTDGSGTGADAATSMCRDEMGNIYVAGTAYIGSSSYELTTAKYNQLGKNELAIEYTLQMISHGFKAVRRDSASKQIIYNNVKLNLDSIASMRIYDFISQCSSGMKTKINDSIFTDYSLNSSFDWITILQRKLFYQEAQGFPFILIDFFYNFTESGFIHSTPHIAYTYFEDDYPIQSVTYSTGQITESLAISNPVLNIIYFPKPWITKKNPHSITLCGASLNLNSPVCWSCVTPSPIGPLPDATGSSSSQNHEIGIALGMYYNTTWNYANCSLDDCDYPVLDYYNADSYANCKYGILSTLPGFLYYTKNINGATSSIKKVTDPIYSVEHSQYGTTLTLCQTFTSFDDLANQTYTESFALGVGGVYKIVKPGTNLRPVYFSFPYSRTLWYTDGPDMNIAYGSNDDGSTLCTNGGFSLSEDYFVGPCQLCGNGVATFGLSSTQEGNVLATTDLASISNYWQDNVISVGFTTSWNSALCAPSNVLIFNADNNSSDDCVPSTDYSNLGTQIGQLDLNSTGWYKIQNNFTSNATYAPGTHILVHVRANFSNGEHIDDCQSIILGSDANNYTNISVEIRGGINDYSSSVVNYQVDVYLLN